MWGIKENFYLGKNVLVKATGMFRKISAVKASMNARRVKGEEEKEGSTWTEIMDAPGS